MGCGHCRWGVEPGVRVWTLWSECGRCRWGVDPVGGVWSLWSGCGPCGRGVDSVGGVGLCGWGVWLRCVGFMALWHMGS